SDDEYYRSNPTALREISRYIVRALDLQPPELLTKVRSAYRKFHLQFLRFCLDNGGKRALEEVPLLLAALQGHKLAGLLLDSQAASRRHASLVQRFREVRAVLRGYRFGRKVDLGEAEITQLYLEYEALADDLAQAGLGSVMEGSLRVGVAEIQT